MFSSTRWDAQRFRGLDFLRRTRWDCVLVVVAIGSVLSCSGMPSLEEQERHVRANELVLNQLTLARLSGRGGCRRINIPSSCSSSGMKDDSLDSTVEVGEWRTTTRVGGSH